MNWLDRSGLIYSKSSDTGDALNGVLNRAYYSMLTIPKNEVDLVTLGYAHLVFNDGQVSQGIACHCRASHDDVTGLVCTIKREHMRGMPRINILPYWYRPGEFFLYAKWNGYWWAHFFTWVTSLKLIISCWRDYEAKNGAIETDGKLLAWLILERFDMPLTGKICHGLLRSHFGERWLRNMMLVKYEHSHPINLAVANAGH